jgi:hypothetical protein
MGREANANIVHKGLQSLAWRQSASAPFDVFPGIYFAALRQPPTLTPAATATHFLRSPPLPPRGEVGHAIAVFLV